MTSISDPLWTPWQRRWLHALGYTIYEQGAAIAPQAPSADSTHPAPAPAETVGYKTLGRHRPAPAVREEKKNPASPGAGARSSRSTRRVPDRLLLALLRASGRDPEHSETQRLIATWPLAELRGNPAAKRALWPQLRALRKK